MAGKFEVFVDAEAQYRFRLTAPDGAELAVSGAFSDKAAAVAGIEAVRECAGMGLISDLCPADSAPCSRAGCCHARPGPRGLRTATGAG